MTNLLVTAFEQSQLKADLPQFRSGLSVRVHQRIKDGDNTRIQIFEGMIIRVRGNGKSLNSSITVRKTTDGIGVERVFMIHAPIIEKIEIKQRFKVRRNFLWFLRERTGKAARLKEIR